MKTKGAEIVFYPAAFPAHRMLSALAWLNEYYVVPSTRTRPSRIYGRPAFDTRQLRVPRGVNMVLATPAGAGWAQYAVPLWKD